MKPFDETLGEGSFAIRLILHDTGRGLAGVLTGGDSPHVGSVVLAVPRASLANAENPSCDVFTVPVPGHLDYVVAQDVATLLCRAYGEPVSVTAGIHVDDATAEDLETIKVICRNLALKALTAESAATSENTSPEA
ncbi:MAG: hypothetical protein IJG53_05345 [Eggerthellaceae bacterium]|nr:hypothetical protein [Eggerthellaceae bacterium]